MLRIYCRTAWRSLRHNKMTAIINITGLSVGMTAAVLIFLWVQNEMSYDSYHRDAKNIYRMTTHLRQSGWIWETTPLLLADAAKKEVPEIDATARLYATDWPVFHINDQLVYEKNAAYVDDAWFDIFHYDFIEGNAASFSKDPNSIILTATQAKKYFGNRHALGMTIRADSLQYVVKGIVRDAPANSSFQYTSFIPLANLLRDPARKANDEQWGNANYVTFARLRPGARSVVVEKKLTAIVLKNQADGEDITLGSLQDMHFETDLQSSFFVTGNKNSVYIFSMLGLLLLLVACINYVNLTTAKASLRSREVGIKKIVGARRFQLFCQFAVEALLVSICALLVTLVLVDCCLPVFNRIAGKQFELPLGDAGFWKIVTGTLLCAFVLNSVYPALVLSSFRPLNVFRGVTLLKLKDGYFRKGLVTVQFTISIVLITGTIVIWKQMRFVQETNIGYNRAQVLVTHIPPAVPRSSRAALGQSIKQDLLQQSSIQQVSMTNQPMVDIGSYSTGNADWDGHDTTFNPQIAQLSTDADLMKTMDLQLATGRWFDRGNPADETNVVLNETAIKVLRIHQPYIGQRFSWKGKTGQIIGIVKDFKYKSMHEESGPLVVFQDKNWFSTYMIRIAPNSTTRAIHALEATWRRLLPGSPLEYSFLDDTFNELYQEDRRASTLILAFSVIAVAISCLGLFGLAAFASERRAREIGIRKVLGASVAGITGLLTREFIKLVLIAIVIASPIAWLAMDKWLQNFAYRISMNAGILVIAGVVALSIALITISFQAVKAALANPVGALRRE